MKGHTQISKLQSYSPEEAHAPRIFSRVPDLLLTHMRRYRTDLIIPSWSFSKIQGIGCQKKTQKLKLYNLNFALNFTDVDTKQTK